jgi:hypothetical protein
MGALGTVTRKTDAIEGLRRWLEQACNHFAATMGWPETPQIDVKPGDEEREVPEQSAVIIRERSYLPEAEEFGAGKPVYLCPLRCSVEIYVRDQDGLTKDDALEQLTGYLGDLLVNDETLGGLVEDSEIEESAEDEFGGIGTDTIAGAEFIITLSWYSNNPLG